MFSSSWAQKSPLYDLDNDTPSTAPRSRLLLGDIEMQWFETNAPIRQKTLIAFGTLVGAIVILGLVAIIRGDWVIAGTAALTAVVCALLSRAFREAICTPYVSTVVRMEQLAAGDLATPFANTD